MTRTERFNQLYARYERKAKHQIAAGELSWTPEQMKLICRDVAEAHQAFGPGNPVFYSDDPVTNIKIDFPIHAVQTNYSHATL